MKREKAMNKGKKTMSKGMKASKPMGKSYNKSKK